MTETATGAGAGLRGGFRPDVEALRALAVTMVLLFHAGLAVVPGGFAGVDVFFVISGFLITGLLVRELESTARIRFRNFYARRIRRLIPAAATVLAFASVIAYRFSAASFRPTYGGDVASAAGYWANWRFAWNAVQYFGAEIPPSPVQHYWSLSVEEQFYVVWPLLLALVAWGVRRWGWRIRPAMAFALGAVAVPSFVWCVIETGSNQPFAFFDTGARMWELSLGGLIAVGAPWWRRIPRWATGLAAAAGVGLVVLTAATMHADARWPGSLALAPTVGTALIIIAGSAARTVLAPTSRWWRPLVWVGGLSYSLYLWHWPMLVAVREIWGPVSVPLGLAVVALSFFPAWLTHRYIENPIRFSKRLAASPRRSIRLGLGLSGLAVAAGVVVAISGGAQARQNVNVNLDYSDGPPVLDLATVDAKAPLGAALLWPNPAARWPYVPPSGLVTPVPAPGDAVADRPSSTDPNCKMIVEFNDTVPTWCIAGDLNAQRRIVVVGDSKATQWYTALNEYGINRGWRVEFAAKASCSFSEATLIFDSKPYTQCDAWNRAMMDALRADPPELLITSAVFNAAAPLASAGNVTMTREAGIEGFSLRWAELESLGVHVIALNDNPLPSQDIDACVGRNLSDLSRCALRRSSAVGSSGAPALLAAAAKTPGVDVVDLTDYFCDSTTCPAVIGNVIVYRGGYHLTDTYIRTLAPIIAWRLDHIVAASALPSPEKTRP